MAHMSHGDRPLAASGLFAPITGLLHWLDAVHADRARRAALLQLDALSDARLDDLGLSRGDLYDARRIDPHGATALLVDRRDRRARQPIRPR